MSFADSTLQAVDVGDFIVSVVDNIEDVETHFEIRAADGVDNPIVFPRLPIPAIPTLILSAPFAAANKYLGNAKDAAADTGGIDFKNCFLFILLIFPYYRYKSNNMGRFLTSSQRFSPAVLRQCGRLAGFQKLTKRFFALVNVYINFNPKLPEKTFYKSRLVSLAAYLLRRADTRKAVFQIIN